MNKLFAKIDCRRCWNCKHSNTCKDYSTFAFGCLYCERHKFSKARNWLTNLISFKRDTPKLNQIYEDNKEREE